MTVHMVSPFDETCQKFTGQKSLSTYRKAKKCLVEPKELQVGFTPQIGKADSLQCIAIFETLIILLSKEDISAMDTSVYSSIELLRCILLL